MRKRSIIAIIVAIMAISFGGLVSTRNTYAALVATDAQLYKTSVLQGVQQCFEKYANTYVYLRDFNSQGYKALFETQDSLSNATGSLKSDFKKDGVIRITTKVGNSLNDSDLSCEQVFEGYGTGNNSARGLRSYYPDFPTDLTSYGYVFYRNQGASELETGSADRNSDQVTIRIDSVKDNSGNNPSNPVTASGSLTCNGSQMGQGNDKKGWKNWWTVNNCVGAITMSYNGMTLLEVRATDDGDVVASGSAVEPDATQTLSVRLSDKLQNSDKTRQPFVDALSNGNGEVVNTFAGMLWQYFFRAAGSVYGDGGDWEVKLSYTSSAPASDEVDEASSQFKPLGDKKSWAARVFLNSLGADDSLMHTSGTLTASGVTMPNVQYYWGPDNTYALYYKYLENLKTNGAYSDFGIDCSISSAKYVIKVKADQTCAVNLGTNASAIEGEEVSVVGGSGFLEKGSMKTVLEWLSDENSYNGMKDGSYADSTEIVAESHVENVSRNESSTALNGDFCEQSGMSGQTWLFCPAMENMQYTASALDNMVQGWLEVDTDIYGQTDSNGNSTGTFIAWEVMRNAANVLMAVILLVIIFSQLTGYGIDNYGIKKMLPRLVVMAVLINLSFYICEIAVDLSNLLGVGFRDMFGGIGNLVKANASGADPVYNFIGEVITVIFAVVGVSGAASATAITIVTAVMSGGGAMAVIIIVLALLVIVVAILLFFAMLGARMIIVIVCVAISPLAFASYILPNTQSLFKKWWDLFKSALIVFPICGALGGVSYMIKQMVLNMTDPPLFMLVVALLAPYLVFFLLPALLKGAIGAMGKVGGALTAMGGAFRGGISRGQQAIQNTDAYKAQMQEGRTNILRRRVGMGKNNQLTDRGIEKARKAREKGGARQRLYAAQLAAVEKATSQGEEDVSKLLGAEARTEIPRTTMGYTDTAGNDVAVDFGKDFKDGTRESYYARQYLTAAHANDVNGMNAALAAAKAGGMKDKFIAQMVRKSIEQGHLNGMNDNTRRAWSQEVANRYGRDFLGTDMKLSDWMATGAAGGAAGLAAHKVDKNDIKPEDASKMSSDSIAEMLYDGSIDQSMAQEMLARNPNLAPDKKIMVAAVASGKVSVGAVQGMGVTAFKQGAKDLSANHSSGVWGVNKATVDAWTAPTPQNVNVVQNFRSGGTQVEDLNVQLRGQGRQNPQDVDYDDLADWNIRGGNGGGAGGANPPVPPVPPRPPVPPVSGGGGAA